jgi:hypothetical protein
MTRKIDIIIILKKIIFFDGGYRENLPVILILALRERNFKLHMAPSSLISPFSLFFIYIRKLDGGFRLFFFKLIFAALSVTIKGYGGILWEFGLSRARLVLKANA